MSWMRNQLNPSFDAYLGVINRDHPLWGHDSSEWLSDPFNERKEDERGDGFVDLIGKD